MNAKIKNYDVKEDENEKNLWRVFIGPTVIRKLKTRVEALQFIAERDVKDVQQIIDVFYNDGQIELGVNARNIKVGWRDVKEWLALNPTFKFNQGRSCDCVFGIVNRILNESVYLGVNERNQIRKALGLKRKDALIIFVPNTCFIENDYKIIDKVMESINSREDIVDIFKQLPKPNAYEKLKKCFTKEDKVRIKELKERYFPKNHA